MSYAEMEGLIPASPERDDVPMHWRQVAEQQRLAAVQRWLLAALVSLLVLVAGLFTLVLALTAE